ncbi:MAG: molybdopterin-guanine dinucleotide biosynthesis protein B [Mariprofundaceae bacterium]|nr:molybdopterin-guanine dinucleotide biosynthesis protein B [Mariprofundaceae bacterium]
MNVPLLHIVGYSGSGKTTLLERLIPDLKAKGLRVATLKHTHHAVDMDKRGKDSWRHKQAGADTSALVGAGQWMMVCDLSEDFTPQQWANRYASDHDVVLVEGYHSMQGHKIEVVRAARSMQARCHADELLAVVSDVPDLDVPCPQLALDDIDALSLFIKNWLQTGVNHG